MLGGEPWLVNAKGHAEKSGGLVKGDLHIRSFGGGGGGVKKKKNGGGK